MPPHSHHCCSRHLIGGAHRSRCLVFIVVSLAPINVICHRTTETHNSLHVSCSQTSSTLLPQAPAPRCDVFCLRRVRCWHRPQVAYTVGRTRVAVEFQLCQPEQGHGPRAPNCQKGCMQMLQKTRNNTNNDDTNNQTLLTRCCCTPRSRWDFHGSHFEPDIIWRLELGTSADILISFDSLLALRVG